MEFRNKEKGIQIFYEKKKTPPQETIYKGNAKIKTIESNYKIKLCTR